MNGGICADPNVRCSCPNGWEGNQCQTGSCMTRVGCPIHKPCVVYSAICYDRFCKNGGTCLVPNISCSCPIEWKGNQCQIGMTTMYYLQLYKHN